MIGLLKSISILIETLKEQHSEILLFQLIQPIMRKMAYYIHTYETDYFVKKYNSKLLMGKHFLLERYDMSFLTSWGILYLRGNY